MTEKIIVHITRYVIHIKLFVASEFKTYIVDID